MDDNQIHHTSVISTGKMLCITFLFGAVVSASFFTFLHFAGLIQEVGR